MNSPSRVGSRRVLLIAEDLNPGGALLVLHRVLDFLTETGFDVIAITGTPEHISGTTRYIQVDTDARKGGWGVRGRLAEVLPARRLLARYRPDLVIVHATSPGYMYAMMFTDKPVLYHLHPPIAEHTVHLRRMIYPFIWKGGKRIVTVSQWHRANVLSQWGVDSSHVVVFHNYPERAVSMHPQRDVVLTAARMNEDKNPSLWRAVGEALNEKLDRLDMNMVWCAPSISDIDRRALGSLPSRLRLIEVGRQDVMNEYFSRAAIYYQPSGREPQGIAVLEAMQNGIPCVVTENTGMTDAVTDGWNGRVLPQNDAAAHAEAIIDLLDNPARAAEWGSRARELIETRYTALAWKNAYRELLSSVLRSPV